MIRERTERYKTYRLKKDRYRERIHGKTRRRHSLTEWVDDTLAATII